MIERKMHDQQDNKLPKVLMFCPTVRLEPETLYTIGTLQYRGALDMFFTRNNPLKADHNILYNYTRGREWFLAGDWDYMLTVENDMIIPPLALEQLIETAQKHEADIVHGVYVFRHGQPSLNIIHKDRWQSYSNIKDEWRNLWGKQFECGGLGYGCTLIARRVLERLELRTESNGGDSDSQLAIDARKAGFTIYADARVICGHKRPDGAVLWPKPDGGYKVVGTPKADLVLVRCGDDAYGGCAIWPSLGDSRGLVIINPGDDPVQVDRETARRLVASGQLEYA